MHTRPLPHCLLVGIMQLLDKRDRLGACSLVCSAWSAAAAAATPSMDIKTSSSIKSFQHYAKKHGSSLSNISLSSRPLWVPLHLSLPCPNLQSLEVNAYTVQLTAVARGNPTATAYFPGLLQAVCGSQQLLAPVLTSLSLKQCSMWDSADQLTVLTALPELQHLVLSDLRVKPSSSALPGRHRPELTYPLATLPEVLFQRMTKLRYLRLELDTGMAAALQHLSCLSDLQYFALGNNSTADDTADHGRPAGSFQGLQGLQHLTSLTGIALAKLSLDDSIGGSLLLEQLTGLHSLEVEGCSGSVAGDIFAQLPEQLQLVRISDVPGPVGGMQLPYLAGWDGPAQDVVLGALAKLKELTRLHISNMHFLDVDDLSVFSSLTASTALQVLHISFMLFPPGAWDYVIPAGRKLPSLQSVSYFIYEHQHCDKPPKLANTAASCPKLQHLVINVPVHRDQVAALPRLTNLTKLDLAGLMDEDASLVAQLTGLESLSVTLPHDLRDLGWLQLTALRRLTKLHVAQGTWEPPNCQVAALCQGYLSNKVRNEAGTAL